MKRIYLIILFLLVVPFNINASTYIYVDSSNGLTLRSSPSTDSTDITAFINNHKLELLESKLYSGNGCSDGWYKVKSGNLTGYVCSKYTKTSSSNTSPTPTTSSYGRPWTSPEKSIMGAAEFHDKNYVSVGQHTSYLMKFNVAATNKNNLHSNQYQTDIMAPYHKSYKTYDAFVDNKVVDLPFHFIIPIFNFDKNGDKNGTYDNKVYDFHYYSSSVINSAKNYDKKFSEDLKKKGFPDDYIERLNVIHKKHPNWTFEPLDTGLKFSEVVDIQQPIAGVNYNLSYNSTGNRVPSESSGWYIPKKHALKMFIDPRNFLHERYVLMFQTIKYDKNIKEATIQSIINKTSFSGRSPTDNNKKFSEIFLEAGKKHNVSSAFLAASAMQEIRTTTTAISGEPFTYNGKKYSCLYNFLNIGAYGGTNSAYEGLVYAGGGLSGDLCITGVIQNDIKLRVSGSDAYGINLNTKASTYNKKAKNATYYVTNSSGKKLANNAIVKTGDRLYVKHDNKESKYTIVINGDITGKGTINSADLLAMRHYLLGRKKLSGAYFKAADVNNDGKINSADLLGLRHHLLGRKTIKQ